jgi:hypothetical protein
MSSPGNEQAIASFVIPKDIFMWLPTHIYLNLNTARQETSFRKVVALKQHITIIFPLVRLTTLFEIHALYGVECHGNYYSMVQDIIWKADCHSACQKLSCFLYGTRRFITVFTKAHHWTLSRDSRILFAPLIPISLRSILMSSSHSSCHGNSEW